MPVHTTWKKPNAAAKMLGESFSQKSFSLPHYPTKIVVKVVPKALHLRYGDIYYSFIVYESHTVSFDGERIFRARRYFIGLLGKTML